MKIYVVEGLVDCEGSEILYLGSTYQLAEKKVREIFNKYKTKKYKGIFFDSLRITKYLLDKTSPFIESKTFRTEVKLNAVKTT